MATTFRHDLRTALVTTLESFQASWNAGKPDREQVHQVYRARPASLHPPCLYVGPFRTARITHSAGVRTRLVQPQVVAVQGIYDNAETVDRQDTLVDALIEHLTTNVRMVTETVTQPISDEDVELDLGGGTVYFATIITLEGDIAEGRD